MIELPSMLMIGSWGRNAGKTTLASSLIKKFAGHNKIIGIKITAIDTMDGTCPRGGKGCGVCSSLSGKYDIVEETNSKADKDTCKILAAGAVRVFWIRTLKSHLTEAVYALLDIIGRDVVTICESNSLRKSVNPGAFVIVKNVNEQQEKKSVKEVRQLADRIISFDGNNFDSPTSSFTITNNQWAVKLPATAIIIAGGQGSRTGIDKTMLKIEGQPMIKHIYDQLTPHFDQVLISANDISKYEFIGAKIIPDKTPGQGPLMGITSALKASGNDLNFIIAADIPQIDIALMKQILHSAADYDAAIPGINNQKYEPLFAVYKKSITGHAEKAIDAGQNKIMTALAQCNIKYIDITENQKPKNINTMDDYHQFIGRENNADV